MKNRQGAATLYIVVGLTIFLSILTYVFTKTSNLEIDILTYFKNIQEEYLKDTTEDRKKEIIKQFENDLKEVNVIATIDETE